MLSSDRLVDELWGERPPDTAVKVLQGYVSQLRRALSVEGHDGAELLATRSPGYVLNVPPDALDTRRFETLLDQGRAALTTDPRRSAELLEDALGLWRGEPLAEAAYEPFAQAEIARLEELRLAAREGRIDAELALGRHATLVPELESLTSAHPLREHVRAQLMLALYRSGRQAEALGVYRAGRGALVRELGVEPGPELQRLEQSILTQDPALDAPKVPLTSLPRRLDRRLLLVAVLGALLAAAAAAFLLARAESAPTLGPNSLVRIDPGTNRIVEAFHIGERATAIAAVGSDVWVANSGDDTLTHLDTDSGELRTLGGFPFPSSLAAEGQRIWVGNNSSGLLVAIDSASGREVERVRLPGGAASFVAHGDGSLWVTEEEAAVYRVDLGTRRVASTWPDSGAHGIAFGHRAAWIVRGGPGELSRVDADDGTRRQIGVGSRPSGVAVGFGAVWVPSAEQDSVTRVNAVTTHVEDVVDAGERPTAIATGYGSVWVANNLDGTVSRIDPETNQVVATIRTGFYPTAVYVGAGAVWVTAGGVELD